MADDELDPEQLARKYSGYGSDLYPDQQISSSYNQEGGFDGGYQPPKQNYVTADGSDQSKPAPAAYKGFNPNSYAMRQFAQTAVDYKDKAQAGEVPGTYLDTQGGKAVARNEPQQFGQQGSIVDPEEGPFTPEQTANLIQQKGGIEQLAKSHTLPMLAPERQKGYEKYVTLSRAKDLEDKQQRSLRAQANQSADAGKDARMWQQMADTNALQNGQQPGQQSGMGGGVMAMSGRAVGPLFFHGGHYRPMDTMEQAHAGLLNAQAGWMNDRGNTMRDVADTRAQALILRGQQQGLDRKDLEQLKIAGYNERDLARLGVKLAEGQASRDNRQTIAAGHDASRQKIADQLNQRANEWQQVRAGNNQAAIAAHSQKMVDEAAKLAEIIRAKMANAGPSKGLIPYLDKPEDLRKLDDTLDPNRQPTSNRVPGDFAMNHALLEGTLKLLAQGNPDFIVPQPIADALNTGRDALARMPQPQE